MFAKFKHSYKEYPGTFKVLILATYIDRLGSFLLFPFFSVYLIEHFGVGMIQVGILFSVFSGGSIIGSTIGGALADKYGRRSMLLLGLISSGIGSILMGLVDDLNIFFIIAAFLGVLGDLGGPARQAMVVDLLPKDKQAEGFGLLRVAVNLSATIGPMLGGFLASQSYMLLFIGDAVSSLITALIVFIVIPETKPEKQDDKPEESVIKTLIGYKEVLKDSVYIMFLAVSAITVLVYMQMNSTLSVFLLTVYGFPIAGFGLLLSMNALMVVLFQFWITKRISKYAPMKMMAFGTLLYMIGFGMYGFISEIYLFFVAMGILTVGEMIVIPVSQAAVAYLAPEDKRGRYMAVYGYHWAIPTLFGVLAAGLVTVYIGPNWVWYLAGILCLISIIGFWLLHSVAKDRFSNEIEPSSEELSD
ncbi:MAG TPA: MFS transporter [Candidatus Nanopelagicaceae bacterium]|nr:MFS transporter [Candidatus Nanopelagicaceae bacterium]